MRTLLRAFNILNWPLWLKFASSLIFALVFFLVLIALIVQTGLNDIGLRTLKSQVAQIGDNQRQAIIGQLNEAQVELNSLIEGQIYLDQFSTVLKPGVRTQDIRRVSQTLQKLLFTAPQFAELRLLNKDGLIVAQATTDTIITNVGSDENSLAFIQADQSAGRGVDISLTVSSASPLTVEISHSIRQDDGTIFGFLIVTVDNERVFLNLLETSTQVYPIYSYLVPSIQRNTAVTVSNSQAWAQNSIAASPAVEGAFKGLINTAVYPVGTSGESVVGYYAPIPRLDAPDQVLFALVTEVDANAPFSQAAGYLSGPRLFAVVVGVVLVLIILVLLFSQLVTTPLGNLRQAIQAVGRSNFNEPVEAANRGDEIGALATAFVDMRIQVRNLLEDLQARVAARTRDIGATQEISHFVATQRDLQTLLDQTVELIVQKFPNIYYAQIFLLDQDKQYAVLRSGSGEIGKILLARGHRLAFGSVSVIGQVVEQRQTIVARDTATSQVHRRNEFLPDTRSELAIPLQVGNQVIGALDVQSKFRNVFTEDETSVLQTMADQVAVAIENARLYQESLRRLEEIERANQQATRKAWQEYVYNQRQRHLTSSSGVVTGLDTSDLRQQAVVENQIVTGKTTDRNTVPIAVPIQLRGQVLGAVQWELPAADLNRNKLQLAQELANRLAVSLDNARLFQESQRNAERERIVNAISAKLTPQTEIQEILQTTVREVGQALRAPRVAIHLHHQNGNGNGNGTDAE